MSQQNFDLLGNWNLILVNIDNPLPDDFEVINGFIQNDKVMDTRAIPFAKSMLDDAKIYGTELLVTSAYRSVEYQQNLFENSISSYISKGYSFKDSKNLTMEYLALPKTSEHHTGLALDIISPSYQELDTGFSKTDAAKWLFKNSYKYGFILRYPFGKEKITNIKFEPWHYRYVGIEHSKYIMKNNLCLEEYLNKI